MSETCTADLLDLCPIAVHSSQGTDEEKRRCLTCFARPPGVQAIICLDIGSLADNGGKNGAAGRTVRMNPSDCNALRHASFEGEDPLEIDAELDLHWVPAAEVAAGVVTAELLLVGSHVAVDGRPDHVENVRRRSDVEVHLQKSCIPPSRALYHNKSRRLRACC